MITILKYELPAADSVSPALPFSLEIPFTAQVLSLQVARLHNPCLWVRANTEDRKARWNFRWFATGEDGSDWRYDYVGTVQIPTGYADGSMHVHHLFVEHQKKELTADGEKKLPESASLTHLVSRVVDQGELNSSAACAVSSAMMIEQAKLDFTELPLKPVARIGENHQAWGVAFQNGNQYLWCYGNGPEGWQRYSKRRTNLNALMSNNGRLDGPYVPMPLPGMMALKDIESGFFPYTDGPYSDECRKIYQEASDALMANPEMEYLDLPHLPGSKRFR